MWEFNICYYYTSNSHLLSSYFKLEKLAKKTVENLETKLDISSPQAIIKSVLAPTTIEAFKEEFWEKKPLHVKRNDENFYGNILNREIVLKLLEEHTLHYEVDVDTWEYVDGERESLNGDDVVKVEEVKKLFEKANATVQLHQPQRFSVSSGEILTILLYIPLVLSYNISIRLISVRFSSF